MLHEEERPQIDTRNWILQKKKQSFFNFNYYKLKTYYYLIVARFFEIEQLLWSDIFENIL